MDKFSWIKNLVAADQQMQDAGIVDLSIVDDPSMHLEAASLDFLQDLKLEFLKVTSAFNQLSSSGVGPIRVYSIAKTQADFMLFRNGAKLIFSLQHGGGIMVSHHVGLTGNETASQHALTPELKAFGQLSWSYQGHPIQVDHMIRFYMSQFVNASAKMRAPNSHGTEMP